MLCNLECTAYLPSESPTREIYLPRKICNLRSRQRANVLSLYVVAGGQETDVVADADWKRGDVGGGRVRLPRLKLLYRIEVIAVGFEVGNIVCRRVSKEAGCATAWLALVEYDEAYCNHIAAHNQTR